ncbi:glycosyltransferase [uncultured Psychroserpens sp.]|uniref:glycosyltransferase family 2 protein n=1 Tax=uncultured Psychroserpens sp. TaxID=255436 RepID=UPI0026333789|nr:glycosyltransferase [uncultured Psychroserpens sp.]
MLSVIIIILIILYLGLIGAFIYGFDKVKTTIIIDYESTTCFSVIIPFRNEAKHLPKLLDSILKIDYAFDKYELIFVNDSSMDHSVKLIQTKLGKTNIDFTIINNTRLTNAPKKDAITKAIKHSKYNWIITTDADCLLPKYWLFAFDSYIQNHDVKCVAAPVTYYQTNTFFKKFQLLDFLSLQGVGIGGFGIDKPFLCNGANFAYDKSVFVELNGFDGNTHISSGDDIFLLQKVIAKYPKRAHYLKNDKAIVLTSAQENFKELISQRVRWASKTTSYKNWFAKFIGLNVLLMNALVITVPLLVVGDLIAINIFAYLLVIKFSIDFLLLFKTARFFKQDMHLMTYFLSCFLYPFFTVYIAFISVFSEYKWKGRAYSK